MTNPAPPVPNFFALVPDASPNVLGFLYWLCAWADPRHRDASESLHLAGTEILRWLLSDIGGASVNSISTVEFTNHYGPDDPNHMEIDLSYFLINNSHVLLLSGEENPESGKKSVKLIEWDNTGISIVPVCCEAIPVRWHWVDRDTHTLVSGGAHLDIAHLSLKELSLHPIFYREGESRHPLLDEFHRGLMATVAAEQDYETLPPNQWHQQAWQGFYRLLVRSLGGHLYFGTLGNAGPPYCKIDQCQTRPNFVLNDSTLSMCFDANPLLPISSLLRMRLLMEHDQARGLKLKPDDQVFEVYICRTWMVEMPIETYETHLIFHVPVIRDFREFNDSGRINLQSSIKRLSAVIAFLKAQYPSWIDSSRTAHGCEPMGRVDQGPKWFIAQLLRYCDPRYARRRPRLHRFAVALWNCLQTDSPEPNCVCGKAKKYGWIVGPNDRIYQYFSSDLEGNKWGVTTRDETTTSLYRFKYIDDEKGFGIITASNRWLSHGAIIELLSEMNAGAEFFSELRSHFRGWCKIARKSAHPAAMIGDMLLWLDRNLAMSPRIIEGDDFVLRVMSPPVDSEDRNELHRLVDLLFEDVLHKQKLINPRDGAAIREVFEIQRSGMKIRIYTDNREETIGNEGL